MKKSRVLRISFHLIIYGTNDAKSLVQDSFLWNLLNGKCLIWPRTTKTCDQEWQISGDRRVGIWFDSAISEWTTNGQWTNNNCICVLDAIMKVMHSQYVGISVRFPPIPFSNNQLALCQLTKKRQKKRKRKQQQDDKRWYWYRYRHHHVQNYVQNFLFVAVLSSADTARTMWGCVIVVECLEIQNALLNYFESLNISLTWWDKFQWYIFRCARIWPHFDYTLPTFCQHSAYILPTFWLQFCYILTAFWLHSDYILTTFWLHFGYILATFWLHLG